MNPLRAHLYEQILSALKNSHVPVSDFIIREYQQYWEEIITNEQYLHAAR